MRASKVIRHLRNRTFLLAVRRSVSGRVRKVRKATKHANALYLLSGTRRRIRAYQDSIPPIDSYHIAIGNYFLDTLQSLNTASIVYSFGVGHEISFDTALVETYGCDVYMYDPTPSSADFMRNCRDPKLRFTELAIWTTDGTLTLYEPRDGGSASAVIVQGTKATEVPCVTMRTLMTMNNHEHIDVFKADIEGAALPVLTQMLEQEILPTQIVVELEAPVEPEDLDDYLRQVSQLRGSLQDKGYDEWLLPRRSARYYSIEMLFSRRSILHGQ